MQRTPPPQPEARAVWNNIAAPPLIVPVLDELAAQARMVQVLVGVSLDGSVVANGGEGVVGGEGEKVAKWEEEGGSGDSSASEGGWCAPAVERHEEKAQIPGALLSYSEYQGRGVDEPEALAIALQRSVAPHATLPPPQPQQQQQKLYSASSAPTSASSSPASPAPASLAQRH